MAVDESCKNCGKALASNAIYCPVCGAARPGLASPPSTIAVVLLVVLGVVCAVPVWYLLSLLGAGFLANVGPRSGEFVPSWGMTVYFIGLMLLAIAGLVIQARFRLSPQLRAFTLAFLITTLGLFAICSAFGA